jgi:signal transduction histidine kinase
MRFTSLRWRIASLYTLLLVAVIVLAGIVLQIELRRILLDSAQARVDSIGNDIARLVQRNEVLSVIGDALPIDQELTTPGNLDHWASPSTFVEIDTPSGYPEGKSTNMGSATLGPSRVPRRAAIEYRVENTPLGEVFVRDQLIRYPGVALIVKVGESLNIYYRILGQTRELLAIMGALAAVLVAVMSYALSASALEPIERLIGAMREIRSDQLQKRVGWTERLDELGQLARTFDAMLDRLEEGFARERRFISDASHELKTPLTVIHSNAQMLERWADEDVAIRRESLRAIRDESAALSRIVNGMLLLAKAESGDGLPREPVALDGIVAEAVKSAKARADEKGLALDFRSKTAPGQPVVYGDPNLLRQLIGNLIDNAIKFTDRGHINVRLAATGGHAKVEIADTGIGIENESLGKVFDRFYRTDKSRNRAVPGTGLGLAIVRSIARIHDGTVEAGTNPEGGAVFTVTLPTLTSLS